MPMNMVEINRQIDDLARWRLSRREADQRQLELALQQFVEAAAHPDELREDILASVSGNSGVRVAIPTSEPICMVFDPPNHPQRGVLVTVDGSQLAPAPHTNVRYGVVNLAAYLYAYEPGMRIPEVIRRTQLFYPQEKDEDADVYLSEAAVNERRDLGERLLLAEACLRSATTPVIGLLDGGIELWSDHNPNRRNRYRKVVEAHLQSLAQLQNQGIPVAGYIDSPDASPVVRMLELTEGGKLAGVYPGSRPFAGVTDRILFEQLLKPGQRSAMYALHTPAGGLYQNDFAVNFFYLALGDGESSGGRRPYIARIEVPAWVSREPAQVGRLHAMLVDQARLLDGMFYPYCLARAHEEAAVGLGDQIYINERLESELHHPGLLDLSPKQRSKQLLQGGAR